MTPIHNESPPSATLENESLLLPYGCLNNPTSQLACTTRSKNQTDDEEPQPRKCPVHCIPRYQTRAQLQLTTSVVPHVTPLTVPSLSQATVAPVGKSRLENVKGPHVSEVTQARLTIGFS